MDTPDIEHYEREGWAVVEGVFSGEECEELVAHMLDLHAGKKALEGFAPREADQLQRTHNQHCMIQSRATGLSHRRLKNRLRSALGDEPDGIQTMYFWVGSEQGRHQDQYYLPGCMSAWIALMDVDEDNGAMWVQSGSHKGRLLTGSDFSEDGEFHEWTTTPPSTNSARATQSQRRPYACDAATSCSLTACSYTEAAPSASPDRIGTRWPTTTSATALTSGRTPAGRACPLMAASALRASLRVSRPDFFRANGYVVVPQPDTRRTARRRNRCHMEVRRAGSGRPTNLVSNARTGQRLARAQRRGHGRTLPPPRAVGHATVAGRPRDVFHSMADGSAVGEHRSLQL